jgi:hypothetical protein
LASSYEKKVSWLYPGYPFVRAHAFALEKVAVCSILEASIRPALYAQGKLDVQTGFVLQAVRLL